jgi:hypothetical protein
MKKLNTDLGGAFEPDRRVRCIPFDGGGDGVQVRSITCSIKRQAVSHACGYMCFNVCPVLQLLTFSTRTCSIIALRCLDLPAQMANTKAAYRVIAVIEGRSEKVNVIAVTSRIVQDILQYYPGVIS